MKKTYYVTYTFGASIPVQAESEEEAEATVEEMDTDELLALAKDGFEDSGCEREGAMKVRFYDIRWDTDDGNGHKPSPMSLGLPREVTLDVDDDLDVAEEGCDVLSDKYGFCVYGFMFESPAQ